MTSSGPTADFRDFIIWERETNDTIDLKKIYVDMAGDLKAGVMLSQLVYWRLPRKNRSEEDTRLTIQREGRMWLAKSDRDWWKEIRLTPKEALGARRTLEQRGIATFRVWKFGGDPTTHISINEDRFMELWEQLLRTPLEAREAGRVEPKVKRELVRNKGSKPQSGNRRAGPRGETDAPAGDTPGDTGPGTPRFYQKGNNQITERVITELPKGQYPDHPNGNNEITDLVISYTETPAESPPENPSEIPTENSSIIPGTELESSAADDEPSPSGETPEGLPEDTGAEDGADPLLDLLVGMSVEGGESGPAPDLREVPAAAAAPVEHPADQTPPVPPTAPATEHVWAILALEPIPLAELQARPARDPERLKVLRALMQATSPSRLGHLHEQLSMPGTNRHLLPRLTDDELTSAVRAAQHDRNHVHGGMSNAGYYALDRLLGKQFTPQRLSGRKERLPQPALGRAYEVRNRGAQVPVDDPAPVAEGALALAAGKIWKHKKSGVLVRIARVEATTVHLDGGRSLSLAVFSTTHLALDAASQAAD